MARTPRKSPIEKLAEELLETEALIKKYSEAVSNLKQKKKGLEEKIRTEKLQELSTLMDEREISVDDVMSMIASKTK